MGQKKFSKIKFLSLACFAVSVQLPIAALSQESSTIKPLEDAIIINLQNKQAHQVKKDEKFEVSPEQPYLVRIPGKMPVLVLPANDTRSEVEIAGLPMSEEVSAYAQKEIDRTLSDILSEIGSIQHLTRKKRFDLALQRLDDLQKKHDKVTSLKFIKSSILYLSGKAEDARVTLQEALKDHPENPEGKKLLEEITRR